MPGIFGVIEKKPLKPEQRQLIFASMKHYLVHKPWYRMDERVLREGSSLGTVSTDGQRDIKEISFEGKEYLFLLGGYVYEVGEDKIKKAEDPGENIIAGISREGTSFLPRICGNYVIGILRKDTGDFLLFNDRMGSQRTYYADLDDVFLFAPEVKAISFTRRFKKDLDWKGLSDFFNYGYIVGDNTFFSDIRSLSSSSIAKVDAGTGCVKVEKYWNPRYSEEPGSVSDIAERGYSLLRSSIHEKVTHAESVISPISGGLDSRLILATLKEIDPGIPVKPLTYAQQFSHEYKIARQVCSRLGMENHLLVEISPVALIPVSSQAVWLSEGMIPMTNTHLLLLPSIIKSPYSCVLNGIYGGPTNYDAPYYREDHLDARLSHEQKTKDIAKVISLGELSYRGIFQEPLAQAIGEQRLQSISEELKNHLDVSKKFCFQRDAFFIENRMRRFITQSSLYRFYWEEQLPLSNYNLYDFYLSTPGKVKLRRNLLKAMLRLKFPEMAEILDSNTGLNLYQEPSPWYRFKKRIGHDFKYYASRLSRGRVVFYDKSAYAHYASWFQKHRKTREFYRRNLLSIPIRDSGIFNAPRLEEHFEKVAEGGPGFSSLVRLVTFSIWYKFFVLEDGVLDVRKNVTNYIPNFK